MGKVGFPAVKINQRLRLANHLPYEEKSVAQKVGKLLFDRQGVRASRRYTDLQVASVPVQISHLLSKT